MDTNTNEPSTSQGMDSNTNEPSTSQAEETKMSFADMGLDGRILKSIAHLGWKEPTLIQEKGIPLAIHKRKDILSRGRTGSGKTGSYIIPILHLILANKKANLQQQDISAVILAPSKELSAQICKHTNQLNQFTSNHISILDIGSVSGNTSAADMKQLVSEKPDIIISTPSKLLSHVKSGNIKNIKEMLQFLVLDEADLMFSFGYEADLEELLKLIVPNHGCQSFLVSATLNPEISCLKKLCLKNPVTLKLEESDLPDSSQLIQYHIRCEEEDKYVLINSLFKLKLVRGRTIIFTNCVDKCYKLKLFLQTFGIRSCILNPELPVASRCHVVERFNEGDYEIIIASDDKSTSDAANRKRKQNLSTQRKKERDEEFGVSRGIDFQFVSNVINFDFPCSVSEYVHRVGRTGRGDREGTALSFVRVDDNKKFEKVKKALESVSGEDVLKAYQFKMDELDGIKYRSREAVRAITQNAIKEARLSEIKRELINSEKLETFFKQHPKDLKVLRSDASTVTHLQSQQPQLKDLPDYIIPASLRAVVHGRTEPDIRLTVVSHSQKRKRPTRSSGRSSGNPLKTFSFKKGRR